MRRRGSYPSFCSRERAAHESRPLCALGWPHGRQGTIRLLFVGEKLQHPIAIIYGRKDLMFLEEVGCGGLGVGGRRLTSCAILSTSLTVPERVLCGFVCWGVWEVEFQASPALAPGVREGLAFFHLKQMWDSSVPCEPSSSSDFLMLSHTIAHSASTPAEIGICCVDSQIRTYLQQPSSPSVHPQASCPSLLHSSLHSGQFMLGCFSLPSTHPQSFPFRLHILTITALLPVATSWPLNICLSLLWHSSCPSPSGASLVASAEVCRLLFLTICDLRAQPSLGCSLKLLSVTLRADWCLACSRPCGIGEFTYFIIHFPLQNHRFSCCIYVQTSLFKDLVFQSTCL